MMIQYTVFWSNKRENNKVYKKTVEIPFHATVKEGITDIIFALNQLLAEEQSRFTLSADDSIYDLYKAKKSGIRRTDYPGSCLLYDLINLV